MVRSASIVQEQHFHSEIRDTTRRWVRKVTEEGGTLEDLAIIPTVQVLALRVEVTPFVLGRIKMGAELYSREHMHCGQGFSVYP